MTETKNQGSIAEAVTLIDRGLGDISERSLVSTAEVAVRQWGNRVLRARTNTLAELDCSALGSGL
jgi:hypothetical protein